MDFLKLLYLKNFFDLFIIDGCFKFDEGVVRVNTFQ